VVALAATILVVVRLSTGRGTAQPEPVAVLATLVAATGPVVLESPSLPEKTIDLPLGGAITAGRAVATRPGLYAALALAGGALRLDENSRLRIDSPREIVLMQGAVYVETSQGIKQDSSLQVSTSLGVIRDVGTRFEVRIAGDRLRVRIRDGEVVVSARGATARAGGGMEVSTGAQGLLTRAAPTFGADWEWIARTAPRFDLAGRNLAEFLDWVSREGGYTISVDDETRATAKSVILQGSVEGLTPVEALDVVLPSTGLEHRIIDGRVVIRSR
jgi:ferric-dicitrate binding protein FerR (iron transport regulator)